MIFTLQNKVKELLEAEMTASGYLPDVATIQTGDFKLLPHAEYPAIFVDDKDGFEPSGFREKVTIEVALQVYCYTLNPDSDGAKTELENMAFNHTGTKGVGAYFLKNPSFQIDSIPYLCKVGKIQGSPVTPGSDKVTGVIVIPLNIKTMRTL